MWPVAALALGCSFPPRGAELDSGPALPGYAPTAANNKLEAQLQTYIEGHPLQRSAQHPDVPAELREQLDALGYARP